MRRLTAALGVVALAATACTSGGGDRSQPAPNTGDGPNVELVSALRSFDGCGAFVETVKNEALERVGPYGLSGVGDYGRGYATAADSVGGRRMTGVPTTIAGSAAGTATATAEAGSAAAPTDKANAGTDFSTTNIQEEGVDEPDLDKTDGRTLYVVVGDKLRVIDVSGDRPAQLGELQLTSGVAHQLLLDGSRALILSGGALTYPAGGAAEDVAPAGPTVGSGSPGAGSTGTSIPDPGRRPPLDTTVITTVDVSNPSAPTVTAEATVEGRLLDARMVDGVARIVTSATPRGFDFVYPSSSGAQSAAVRNNRRVIESSNERDWLPTYTVEVGPGAGAGERPLVECGSVAHTSDFAGFGTLSVSTVDLRGDGVLDPASTTSVQTDGANVYASSRHLYVATPSSRGTAIHEFDMTGNGPARYMGSGEVRGSLLDQFSMSEHDGILRVATTDNDVTPRAEGGSPPSTVVPRSTPSAGATEPSAVASRLPATQSYVTTMRADSGELRLVGQVGGLGRGEQIRAVRFIGTTGYVVTFRQTDPLYTIDLRDPSSPTVVGELKIPGYSSYLQPLGEGRLLGIGQDATSQGRTTGLQVALFDVTDPANPQQVRKYTLAGANSSAETEHHALLWWAPENLALIPVEDWGNSGPELARPFVGAVGLDVTDAAIDERGRIEHGAGANPNGYPYPGYGAPILRTLVVGSSVVSISDAGLATSAMHDLAIRSWLAFT